MKTKFFPLFVLAAGFIAVGASAQVATPTLLAPAADAQAVPQASQMVYLPRLPAVAELTNVAAAQGLTIDRIIQTVSQMTVVYRSANGSTNTVAYLLLPAADSAPAASTVAIASPSTPAPQVVYTPAPAAPRVVYYAAAPAPAPAYYYDPFYYPGYYNPWYSPVSLSVGFGLGYYSGSYHRGGHGGYRGGHGGHH